MRQSDFIRDGYDEEVMRLLLEDGPSARVLVMAAHTDDEAIGMGAFLKNLTNVAYLHLTDGAARNMRAAKARGFPTRREYALARRGELMMALNHMRSAPVEMIEFGIPDLEVSYNLVPATLRLLEVLRRLKPSVVFVHPYEGGHPDHDSAAFCARAASIIMQAEDVEPPAIIEYTSYHADGKKMATSSFLPTAAPMLSIRLTQEERALKTEMFNCYSTQRNALKQFETSVERFRRAPSYDFTRPPHPGRLFYQNFYWGLPGLKWCRLAEKASSRLGIPAHGGVAGPRLVDLYWYVKLKLASIL